MKEGDGKMNYHNITHDDMKNGEGIRVVLWVSGCEHHCKECHNPETWDKNSGIEFDIKALVEILWEVNKDYIKGLTISGGDPFMEYNEPTIYYLCCVINKMFGDSKDLWIYTGYTFQELWERKSKYTRNILSLIDVLIDGEYKKEERDVKLKWRGSKNQRVINVKETIKSGEIVLWCN